MRDYLFAIGNDDPYGFSAPNDGAAIAHAIDYLASHRARVTSPETDLPVVLSSPDARLTEADERMTAFAGRVLPHVPDGTDDVRPADPTPPDCNMS